MRIRVFIGLIVFAVLGRSQSQNAQRIGDLLIGVARVHTPATLGSQNLAPPSDHYWVVADLTFRNVGQQAVCAGLSGSLKAEFGLIVNVGSVAISELLPGEEVHGSYNFALKRGANPLELALVTQSYGSLGCGSALPQSAVRTATFTITGVSTPPLAAPEQPRLSSPPSAPPPSAPPPAAPSSSSATAAYRTGGGVSAPVPIYQPEPEYTEEARKAKWKGSVLLSLVVDETGKAVGINVTKSLGLGLDQRAIECVQKWRWKPGMKDGKPVPVMASVEVNFRLM